MAGELAARRSYERRQVRVEADIDDRLKQLDTAASAIVDAYVNEWCSVLPVYNHCAGDLMPPRTSTVFSAPLATFANASPLGTV